MPAKRKLAVPDHIQIRLVQVEFLRPGPPHNQLLSPLTQYLAISGDAGAGVVTVPYEHATFERRLRELRYETGDPGDRQAMLHATGVEMGRILGAVPGLPGALATDPNRPGTLIHLRLTLSASELALLPFEIAKAPISPTSTAESCLSIQSRPPVCVTRNIRTVSPEGVVWPEHPRVLFVAGHPDTVPYAEHREVLLEAIRPFQRPGGDDLASSESGAREQFGGLLTILIDPTLTDVFRECRDGGYTHVHILTHGDVSDTSQDAYGLVLRGEDDAPEVVSGERFASALTSIGSVVIHRPTVVTVASCDSGNVGTVIIPGASFAHALHQAGVPLVVASQFPLSKEGFVPLAATLYEGLLWGEHPLVLLQQVRAELHARYTSTWHDWASLVVYEALPYGLNEQLESLRYVQGKRAIDAALEQSDLAIRDAASPTKETFTALGSALERAVDRLPTEGQFAIESVGLRASASKRLAERAFTLGSEARENRLDAVACLELLERARLDYERAVRALFVNGPGAIQRVVSLHWVLVQAESLGLVLGHPSAEGRWAAAKLSADLYLDHAMTEQRAWAVASLAELWLIRLGDPDLPPAEGRDFSERVVQHARELQRLCVGGDQFPGMSTRRQFERYVSWWGSPRFEAALGTRGIQRGATWRGESGIVETAKRVVSLLEWREEPGGAPFPPPPAIARSAVSRRTTAPAVHLGPPHRSAAARFVTIEMLEAGHGDCLWIEYGDGRTTHRWLNDCGTQQTARELLRRVDQVPENERRLELFVMTHIDSDHIGGALPFFRAVKNGLTFGDVWFNGWRHLSGRLGARQGEMFSTAIQDFELPWNAWREGRAIVIDSDQLPVCVLPGGMTLTLLSPTPGQLKKLAPVWAREMKRYGLQPGSRVDYSRLLKGHTSASTDIEALADTPFAGDGGAPNGTSIGLLAEYAGMSALFGADAHAPVLVASIRKLLGQRGVERLRLDAFKVSHHGSQNNVTAELIQLLDCRRYLISTNGEHFSHPDRQAIARILKYGGAGVELYFNFRSKHNEIWARPDLQEKYGYRAHYPGADRKGTIVSLGG
ncbi:MAG: CHAT domain-containing protein [Luteitalea sp.]|nr:CHAT domain-containing protein [Luteitalea sp.]